MRCSDACVPIGLCKEPDLGCSAVLGFTNCSEADGDAGGACVVSLETTDLPACAPPPSLAAATVQLLSDDCSMLGGRFDLCTDGSCVPSGQSCTGWCEDVRLTAIRMCSNTTEAACDLACVNATTDAISVLHRCYSVATPDGTVFADDVRALSGAATTTTCSNLSYAAEEFHICDAHCGAIAEECRSSSMSDDLPYPEDGYSMRHDFTQRIMEHVPEQARGWMPTSAGAALAAEAAVRAATMACSVIGADGTAGVLPAYVTEFCQLT